MYSSYRESFYLSRSVMNYKKLILGWIGQVVLCSFGHVVADSVKVENCLSVPVEVNVTPQDPRGLDKYCNSVIMTNPIEPHAKKQVMTIFGYPPYEVIVKIGKIEIKAVVQDIKAHDELIIAEKEGIVQIGIKRSWPYYIKDQEGPVVVHGQMALSVAVFNSPLKHNEDRWVMSDNKSRYAIYGIFDGHGGNQVAEYAKKSLIPKVLSKLSKKQSPQTALSNSFIEVDKEVCDFREISLSNKGKYFSVGSCAIVVLIDKVTQICYTAHVGDSRAILVKNNGVVALSSDHKPDTQNEALRIKSAGAAITMRGQPGEYKKSRIVRSPARVEKVLAVSRVLGDYALKQIHPGAIIAEPEISVTHFDGSDESVVIASDGIWDVLDNAAVANIVQANRHDVGIAARTIVQRAEESGSRDDLTAMVIDLQPNL